MSPLVTKVGMPTGVQTLPAETAHSLIMVRAHLPLKLNVCVQMTLPFWPSLAPPDRGAPQRKEVVPTGAARLGVLGAEQRKMFTPVDVGAGPPLLLM